MKSLRQRVKEFSASKHYKMQAWPQDIRDAVVELTKRVGDITASEKTGIARNTVTNWADQAGLTRQAELRRQTHSRRKTVKIVTPAAAPVVETKPVKAEKAIKLPYGLTKGAKIVFKNGKSIDCGKLMEAYANGLTMSLSQIEEAMSLLSRRSKKRK